MESFGLVRALSSASMDDARSSAHLVWHALAAFGVALAGTIATAPFAAGWTCTDRDLAWSLALCTPLVALLPGWLASPRRYGRTGATAVSAATSIGAGAVNAVVVWVVSESLHGGSPLDDDLGLVLLFALPFGGIPGAAFGVPMGFGTWFARTKLAAPAGAIGAARGLLLVVAVVGAGTSALVVTTRDLVYTAWPVVLAFDVIVAVLCLAVATRDVLLALRIHRLASDATGTFAIVDAPADAPPAGLPRVLDGGGGGGRSVQIVRTAPQDAGPYRATRLSVPILSLAAPPRATIAALARAALLLVLCAGILGWSATQAPRLAPLPPLACLD